MSSHGWSHEPTAQEALLQELVAWEPGALLDASHRGLQRELIPLWLGEGLGEGRGIGTRIEESAFGQTPLAVIYELCDGLELCAADIFLDLGAGAGRLLHAVSRRCAQAVGFERNPTLWAVGEELRRRFSSPSQVFLGDFFESEWPEANKGFATTVRWSEASRRRLAEGLVQHPSLVCFATLGPPLPLALGTELEWDSLGDCADSGPHHLPDSSLSPALEVPKTLSSDSPQPWGTERLLSLSSEPGRQPLKPSAGVSGTDRSRAVGPRLWRQTEQGTVSVVWNPGERTRTEPLTFYRRQM